MVFNIYNIYYGLMSELFVCLLGTIITIYIYNLECN